jgi:hypothetical protein
MKKVLKIGVGVAVIGYAGCVLVMAGEALPLVCALYRRDYEGANACTKAIAKAHGCESTWFAAILDIAMDSANLMLKRDGARRRVEYIK